MSITSNLFLTVLIPFTVIASLFLRKSITKQNIFLILINTIFISFSGVGGLLLLCTTCIVDYWFIKLIQKDNPSRRASILFGAAIILNVAPLLLYKYTGFFLSTVNSALNIQLPILQLTAPLGISFYTFQAISLLADVKTQKISYCPKFREVFFYLTFFVTISSGPIVRFDTIYQSLNRRSVCASDLNSGISRFVIGLAKKSC